MSVGPRLIARIALFSALAYVLSWLCTYVPNVNPIFFIVFLAAFMWGLIPGVLVGVVGMGLWTTFHPYGPAIPVIAIAQVGGTALSGAVGSGFELVYSEHMPRVRLVALLGGCGLMCSVLFFVPVSLVDAWVFQPFWPRFVTGMVWSIPGVVSNAVVFPLLFWAARPLYARERALHL